jgi:hypothetical protein
MMVLEVNETVHRLIIKKKDSYIPLWVRGEIDIPITVCSKDVKNDLRKIRKIMLRYKNK